ncbi:MAG: hypothetical protein IJY66_00140, partial [Clostridia bacterium]|nr:hypothetical protein [Clostridia bacterium]
MQLFACSLYICRSHLLWRKGTGKASGAQQTKRASKTKTAEFYENFCSLHIKATPFCHKIWDGVCGHSK